jgi:uncharacterized damage-inducible protein DinB
MNSTQAAVTGERADLLVSLGRQRNFLRHTVQNLTDEQARQRTTVSELCLGGLIKHVAAVEQRWMRFIANGPSAMASGGATSDPDAWVNLFRMLEGETLAGLLAEYDRVARETDEFVAALPDLDADQPLPNAPWFPPGSRWTARRVLLHVIAETAQHSGHADIIRESLDGQKTMG